MAIADQVLATQEHLEFGGLDPLTYLSQALPGVFLKITQADVKCRTAPHLQREEPNLVHLFQNRQHILSGHPGGNQ